MAIDLAQLAGGALGGAIVSSVLGPWIVQSRDRREARADVLRQLALVERTRWADRTRSWDAFQDAARGLRASALVAGAPRALVDRYIRLATIARRMSERSAQAAPPEEGGGGIVVGLADLPRDAASRLTDHLWHPRRRGWRLSRDLRELDRKEADFRADELLQRVDPIDWDGWTP